MEHDIIRESSALLRLAVKTFPADSQAQRLFAQCAWRMGYATRETYEGADKAILRAVAAVNPVPPYEGRYLP